MICFCFTVVYLLPHFLYTLFCFAHAITIVRYCRSADISRSTRQYPGRCDRL